MVINVVYCYLAPRTMMKVEATRNRECGMAFKFGMIVIGVSCLLRDCVCNKGANKERARETLPFKAPQFSLGLTFQQKTAFFNM